MIIISRTPVRISFFGGGSDYPDYYLKNKGAVLGTTIDKFTHVSVNTLSNFFDHKIRIGYSKTELVKTVEEIEHPSIRECLKFKNVDENLDIHIFSDLPAKTGLGSSSSFTVGFLNALYALNGQKTSKHLLAKNSCYIEQKLIQENVGSQDQYHAAFGGFNVIEFDQDEVLVRPVVISQEKKHALEDHLLIFYTGLTRFASQVVQEQIQKTKESQNDQFLKEMVDMVWQAENIISKSPLNLFVQDFATLLDLSWALKKKLSSKISTEKIDYFYEKAKEQGAWGGKLCGAGSGGFLALFAPKSSHNQIRNALKDLLEVKFKFENSGSTIIYMKD